MAGNRRSGRRRIPTAIQRAKGAEIRHNVEAEPKAPEGIPPRPPHLDFDPEAAAAWDAIAPRLLAQHVLTEAHGELLGMIADAWAQYVRLQRDFAHSGRASVIVQEWISGTGQTRRSVVANPLVRQIRAQAVLLNSLFGEFGQTPASAPKVAAKAPGPDPFESFLAAPPGRVVAFEKKARTR